MQNQLAPFVNAKLNRARDENGYMIPRTTFVDIVRPGISHIDADIRAVDDDGVTIFRFGAFSEVIPWGDITAIEIRGDLNSQIAQARKEMGAARWEELNREFER